MTPSIDNLPKTDMEKLREELEEDTTYLVEVAVSENNVVHQSILFMGFKTGSYCEVYNNTYDGPISMDECYYIKVIKKLAKIKK